MSAQTELQLQQSADAVIFGAIGDLEVRLAQSADDIAAAQRLRYQVFFEEMSADPTALSRARRRDEDSFDAICDHFLVVDRTAGPDHPVIGTYRVLRDDVAARRGVTFYTQREYDLSTLFSAKGSQVRFMELGRSCVLKPYRNRRTVELLWHGLWTYVRQNAIDVMIGCASFQGTEPAAHAMALSFLHHHARAPAGWSVRAHEDLFQDMDLVAADQIDRRAALKAMPPLIKGYLRLGAFVGDGAVIDYQFGTTDVLIILPVERIRPRYFAHFGAPDEQTARIAGSVSSR